MNDNEIAPFTDAMDQEITKSFNHVERSFNMGTIKTYKIETSDNEKKRIKKEREENIYNICELLRGFTAVSSSPIFRIRAFTSRFLSLTIEGHSRRQSMTPRLYSPTGT